MTTTNKIFLLGCMTQFFMVTQGTDAPVVTADKPVVLSSQEHLAVALKAMNAVCHHDSTAVKIYTADDGRTTITCNYTPTVQLQDTLDLNTRLANGVRNNNFSEAWQAIKLGASGNVITVDGTPLLILAARHKSTELMGLLISHGADINAQEPGTGYTALHVTVVENFAAGSQFLIAKGADKSLFDAGGETARNRYHYLRCPRYRCGWGDCSSPCQLLG